MGREVLEAHESTADRAQDNANSTRASLHKSTTTPVSVPRRDYPWDLVQSMHSEHAVRVTAPRYRALLRARARALEEASGFKRKPQVAQVQCEAKKQHYLLVRRKTQ